ncbi:MAG: ammonium transporter [Actinomycetes bacterium]|jgi:Amt family ammonium transporter|nr:ammonium transporter [Actinomycetes bacterium]
MENAGSLSFMLLCSAMVLLMTPGLAFFYGGLGERKNVGSNMMNSIFAMGIGILMWGLVGYSLSFGGDGLFIGSLKHFAFLGINTESMTGDIPTYAFAMFQMMFALITPAIITGSISGRMKFKALLPFVALWSLIVYYPMAHMVWGQGGLLGTGWLDSIDFAGGNVVHIASGVSGLVLCLLLGKRKGYGEKEHAAYNIPYVVLGTGLLWFGWFGFNAGSALAADGLALHAAVATAISSGTAMVSWMAMDAIFEGKATLVGACTGAVAGLVGITPGAGFVPIWAAFIIGLGVSPVCFFAIKLIKDKLKIDDTLDAFGCHGVGGIFGGLMTGIFASPAVNEFSGVIYGNWGLLGRQAIAIIISIVVAVAGTLICAGIVRIFTKLRVEDEHEEAGLDLSLHGENAHSFSMPALEEANQ